MTPAGQLAWAIDTLAARAEAEQRFAAELFSRHRERTHLVELFPQPDRELPVDALLALPPEAQVAVEAFSRALAAARDWALTTEDMAATVSDRLAAIARRLRQLADPAVAALGGVPGSLPRYTPPEAWMALMR